MTEYELLDLVGTWKEDTVARITESNTHAATAVGLERYCSEASDLRAVNHSC